MTQEETKSYLLNAVYDSCTLEKECSRKLEQMFDKSEDYDTMKMSIDSLERARAEIFSVLANDISFLEEPDGFSFRVNGKKIGIQKQYRPGNINITENIDESSITMDDFPSRSSSLLNYKEFNIDELLSEKRKEDPKPAQINSHPQKSEEKKLVKKEGRERKPNEISYQDLIMNAYQIEYPEENEQKRVMTVILVPLSFPRTEQLSAPIFAMAKKDGKIVTTASENDHKSSVFLSVGGESVSAKGAWVGYNRFKTFLYPQKTLGREIKITKKEYSPNSAGNIGHFIYLDDMSEIHLFPMATQNSSNGYVQFIACIRSKRENGYQNATVVSPTGHNLKFKNYLISAKWQDGILHAEITKE